MSNIARVVLRPPQPEDREEFLKMVRSSRKLHRPWVYAPDTVEKFQVYIQRVRDDRNAGFLVCLREESAIVGVVNISEIIHGALRGAFIGFYGAAGYSGKGYMTEAVGSALRHAFTKLRLHRVEANIQPSNQRSIALVRRCGFRLEGFSPRYLKIGGRWRDHERWAITVEDWLQQRTIC